MLILLTGCYVGLIWLIFFKLELLPWNKVTRNASILIGVAGLVAVIIGLVQGSPTSSGGIQINAKVTQIAAHSTGRVVAAPSRAFQPMKKGDLILQIDPTQYEHRVLGLEAALAAAINGVEQMKAALAAARADVGNAQAQLEMWNPAMAASTANREGAAASVKASEAQVASARAEVKRNEFNVKTGELQVGRIRKLVEKSFETQADLDKAENQLTAAKAALESAQALERKSAEDVVVREANLKGARAGEEQTRDQLDSLKAMLAKAEAAEKQARLQLESTVDGEHTSVRQVREQLENAKYDLAETKITAPDDGYLMAFGVTVGDYIRTGQVGTFVATGRVFATATFDQTVVQNVKPGQTAEIALASRPGEIIKARVDAVIWASGEAQVPTSGTLPMVDQIVVSKRLVVRFELEDFEGELPRFGASGEVAIYTDYATPISVVRKIILRISSLLYYLG